MRLDPFFFHECGRHVGGVPRSSWKGKETQHDEGKRTQATPEPNKTQTKTRTKNQNTPKGQRPFHPHQKVFPLYQGETCEKDCETNLGPEFTMKVGRHGRRKSGVQQSLSKGLRPTHQAVTKGATASNGKDDDQVLCKTCIVYCHSV